MKLRNMIIRTSLTVAVVCGTVAAIPAVTFAAGDVKGAVNDNHDHIYIKCQQMDYTTEDGEKLDISVTSNSDGSEMVMYINHEGDKERAKLQRNAEGKYEVVEGTSYGEDAVTAARIASSNGQWREM
ncbi:MAG: hypothetical protein IJ110_02365 [Lachnospiraceae bacterium]|nr:hypothetical protein [Lachnospiraceae bacterium]